MPAYYQEPKRLAEGSGFIKKKIISNGVGDRFGGEGGAYCMAKSPFSPAGGRYLSLRRGVQ